MILAGVAVWLAVLSAGQQTPATTTAAESRAMWQMRMADAAAATEIPRLVVEARGKGVVQPRPLYMPNLEEFYPPAALRVHQEGVARLRCTLTVTGRFEACMLETSSGAPLLDAATFEVAKYARYSPRIVDGVPEAMRAILPVRWVIAE